MYTALIIFHALICVLLIGIVLIQSSKGAGLSGVFSADSGDSFMGAGTGNFLTKLTTGLAVVFMLTSCSLAFLSVSRHKSVMAGKGKQALSPAQVEAQKQVMEKIKEMAAQKQAEAKAQAAQDKVDAGKAEVVKVKQAQAKVEELAPTVADVLDKEEGIPAKLPEVPATADVPQVSDVAKAPAEVEVPEVAVSETQVADVAVAEVETPEVDAPVVDTPVQVQDAPAVVEEEQTIVEMDMDQIDAPVVETEEIDINNDAVEITEEQVEVDAESVEPEVVVEESVEQIDEPAAEDEEIDVVEQAQAQADESPAGVLQTKAAGLAGVQS